MIERQLFHSGFVHPVLAYLIGLAVGTAVLVLLWRELRRRKGGLRYVLFLTRAGMIMLLTLLLAQPNYLVIRRKAQQGRSLIVLDDSASMFVADNYQDATALLNVAELLELPEAVSRDTRFLALSARLEKLHHGLAPLAEAAGLCAESARSGLPWPQSAAEVLADSREMLMETRELMKEILESPEASQRIRQISAGVLEHLGDASAPESLIAAASAVAQTPQWNLIHRRVTQARDGMARASNLLDDVQAEADARFLSQHGRMATLREHVAGLTRYALAQRLVQNIGTIQDADIFNLASGTSAVGTPAAVGHTDLVRPLVDSLTERPVGLLDSVVLFSDGGQNRHFDPNLLDLFRKRKVQLVTVGIGDDNERAKVALLDYDFPPLAAGNTTILVNSEWRFNFPEETELSITYSASGMHPPSELGVEDEKSGPPRGRSSSIPRGTAVRKEPGQAESLPYTETFDIKGAVRKRLQTVVKLPADGLQVLQLHVKSKDGAVDAMYNFHVYVPRKQPSVLLVAERPDKLAQEILAQRQYGVRVYPVFTYGRKENAKRGRSIAALPQKADDWGRYDLIVIIGEIFPGFTKDDAESIAASVRAGTLNLLLTDGDDGSAFRTFAPLFGWQSAGLSKLSRPSSVQPAAEAAHLPMLRLAGETIRNQNLWEQFQAPRDWHSVPNQQLVLLRHPTVKAAVASLGFYESGRVACLGLGGVEPMNDWQSVLFARLVRNLTLDLLTPILPPDSETGDVVAAYPPIGVTDGVTFLVIRSNSAGVAETVLHIEEPDGLQQNLVLSEAAKGAFLTTHAFGKEGKYRLRFGTAEHEYTVRAPESAELRDLGMKPQFLEQLAAAADGISCAPATLSTVLDDVPVKTRESVDSRIVAVSDFTIPFLLLFALLACADFAIRKQIGLAL